MRDLHGKLLHRAEPRRPAKYVQTILDVMWLAVDLQTPTRYDLQGEARLPGDR